MARPDRASVRALVRPADRLLLIVARAFYAAFPDRDFFGSAKELISKRCSSMDPHRNLLVGVLMLDLDHFACDASRLR